MKKQLKNLFVKICRLLFGVRKKKILFISFDGKSYSDNPRAISEALYRIYPSSTIIWVLNKKASKNPDIPHYVKKSILKSKLSYVKYYFHLATSAVVVNNFSLTFIPKSKKQFFISTWHGDKAFKKVQLDATAKHVTEEIPGFCDLAICGSKYGKNQWESAFNYKGNFYESGTPRNDVLVNKDLKKIESIKKSLGVFNKKVILFAPTMRDALLKKGENHVINDFPVDEILESLQFKTGNDWVFLVRAHPAVSSLLGFFFNNQIIDVSEIDDMAKLLQITDILITDYSSCAGDFALTGNAIYLYHPDRNDYISLNRELYFDVDLSPYLVAKSNKELLGLIRKYNVRDANDNCESILDFYGSLECGNASSDVARIIKNRIEGQK